MFKEKNKATLDQAIAQLPVYDPDPVLWNQLVEQLEEIEVGAQMQASLKGLPAYEPPAQVWNAIEEELQLSEAVSEPVVVRRIPRRHMLAVAATVSLLILAGLGNWFVNRQPKMSITISETEEVMEVPVLLADWNEDESFFQEVIKGFESHPLLKEIPEFRSLKEELEELNEAKLEIELMLENYGTDPQLVRQIGEIERERGELLKRMVAMN